jgi:endonuclease/exonuclease/phosphatase (EEP) superfamily protein YafD
MHDTVAPREVPSQEATPAGRRWWTRLRTALVLVWVAFVLANLVVSGHWSMWLVFSLVPPLAFLVGSLATLALALCRPNRRVVLAVALASVALAVPQSGLQPGAITASPRAGEIRVVSWNTEYWDQTDDPAAFFRYLRGTHADVYLLQEYINYVDGRIRPIDDLARIRAEFPGYQVVVKGQLVTLSRLPVIARPPVGDKDALRVDVRTPRGTSLSTYNVHIPAQLDPTRSPLSPGFYRTLTERADQRRHCYEALAASASSDKDAGVIGGDFNTTPAMRDIDRAGVLGEDAAAHGHSVYPVSWNEHGPLRFWRLDWGFVRNGATVRDYRLLEPRGMSDHSAQVIDLAFEGSR